MYIIYTLQPNTQHPIHLHPIISVLKLSVVHAQFNLQRYDNVFVYFQPGNGKVKIKEPIDLAIKAMKQLDEAIEVVKGAI